MPSTRNLAILIFADVEVLDFCGPFEVFSVANRFIEPAAFNVFTVAETPGPVIARNGLSVKSSKYPDPKSKVLHSENNYVLLTFTRRAMTVALKSLDGRVLDRVEVAGK